jgi:GxxExxY protein
MTENEISKVLIGCAIDVHKELGPGLLESTYEVCLEYELKEHGLDVQRQLILPVNYKGKLIDAGYRIDLLVNERVIVELKAVEEMTKVHEAQVITYLKLSGLNLGFLINFNETYLKNGIKRLVNNY